MRSPGRRSGRFVEPRWSDRLRASSRSLDAGLCGWRHRFTGHHRTAAVRCSPRLPIFSSRWAALHLPPRISVSGKDGNYVGSLDAKPENQDSNRLLATGVESDFVPSSDSGSGYLLFIRDGVLLAQPFDARGLALSGEPVAVAEHVGTFRTRGLFSASSNGVLVYKTTDASGAQLTWLDRQGMVVGQAGSSVRIFPWLFRPMGVAPFFSSLVRSGIRGRYCGCLIFRGSPAPSLRLARPMPPAPCGLPTGAGSSLAAFGTVSLTFMKSRRVA